MDDPEFEAKAAAILGLYLKPPLNAAVFCVDEKSAIQALGSARIPVLPLSPGRAERHGFEYFRHGTLSLYAAFDTRSGAVLGKTTERHTSGEFVAFLTELIATQPVGQEIHIILDNLSAHKTKRVAEFLQAHSHLTLHYTPTYSSWIACLGSRMGRNELATLAGCITEMQPEEFALCQCNSFA